MNNREDSGTANRLTILLLVIYFIVLFWILLFKLGVQFSYMGTRRFNLIPFNEFFEPTIRVDKGGLIANVVIFIPLGVYVGLLFKRWSFVAKLVLIFSVSFLFEAIQYVFRIGAFDSTDIATNTFGGMIGLLCYSILMRVFSNGSRTERFINVIGAMGTVTMLVLLVLLKMNMLPIRYQ